MTNNHFKIYLELILDSPEDPAGELGELFNNFTDLNWLDLWAFWRKANKGIKWNILLSFYNCPNNQQLINFTDHILSSNPEINAEEYFKTIQNKTGENDTEAYLVLAKKIWDKYTSKRKTIKQSIWRTGNSNNFLKRFSFKDWQEAGL